MWSVGLWRMSQEMILVARKLNWGDTKTNIPDTMQWKHGITVKEKNGTTPLKHKATASLATFIKTDSLAPSNKTGPECLWISE